MKSKKSFLHTNFIHTSSNVFQNLWRSQYLKMFSPSLWPVWLCGLFDQQLLDVLQSTDFSLFLSCNFSSGQSCCTGGTWKVKCCGKPFELLYVRSKVVARTTPRMNGLRYTSWYGGYCIEVRKCWEGVTHEHDRNAGRWGAWWDRGMP
jgi:hypothetical protein